MADIKYYDVILKPVITEKSMNAMGEKKYTFLSDSLQALTLGEAIDLCDKIILAAHTGSPLSAKNCLRRVMIS